MSIKRSRNAAAIFISHIGMYIPQTQLSHSRFAIFSANISASINAAPLMLLSSEIHSRKRLRKYMSISGLITPTGTDISDMSMYLRSIRYKSPIILKTELFKILTSVSVQQISCRKCAGQLQKAQPDRCGQDISAQAYPRSSVPRLMCSICVTPVPIVGTDIT